MSGVTDRPSPALETLDLRDAALFVRLEGCLVARDGDGGRGASCLGSLLALLEGATRGATVLLTDRPASDLRGRISPIPQCVLSSSGAAGHAARFPASRDASSTVVPDQGRPSDAILYPGLVRDLHGQCRRLSDDLTGGCGSLRAARSADAIGKLLHHPALSGRAPVLIGAAARDAAALERIDRMGGVAIAVGSGLAQVPRRLRGPDDVHALLARWLEKVMGPA
jgi:hypothetical protein